MKTLTAVIRAKPGHAAEVEAALLKVAEHVRANEPETVGFFVSRSQSDPCLFTTYERFVDQAAMDRHNASAASKGFFEVAGPMLDGEVTVVICDEIWSR